MPSRKRSRHDQLAVTEPVATFETSQEGPGRDSRQHRALTRKVASLLIIVVFVVAYAEARDFSGLGQWFPQLAAALGFVVSVVHAIFVWRGKDTGTAAYDTGNEEISSNDEGSSLSQPWIVAGLLAFPALVLVVGAIPAVIAWLPAFLVVVAGRRWWVAALGTGAAVAVLYLLNWYIGMVFPPSLLFGS